MGDKKWLLVLGITSVLCTWIGHSWGNRYASSIEVKIVDLIAKFDKLLGETSTENISSGNTTTSELHTIAEARAAVNKLGNSPSAEKLAEELALIDGWVIKPEEEKEFNSYKLELIALLQNQVKQEVLFLQKEALNASSGQEGMTKYSEAGRILALYPISQDKNIIEEAKKLSSAQLELASRVEGIRRQRYNRWASERIEAAIKGYNANKSAIPYKTDRPKLVQSLIESIGAVDPLLLEPAVLELYNYCIDNTKGVLYESEKIELAKQLSNPNSLRKILGDF